MSVPALAAGTGRAHGTGRLHSDQKYGVACDEVWGARRESDEKQERAGAAVDPYSTPYLWSRRIDQALVKKVVDSFVSLGFDAFADKERLNLYKEKFEAPFLAATEAYYAAEAKSFLNAGGTEGSANITEYLKKVEGRLREEERSRRCLHTKTRKELVGVLLRAHAPRMWDTFPTLLDFDAEEDLKHMYALLARIPEGLEPLRRKFQAHVKAAGLRVISALIDAAKATPAGNVAKSSGLDPKAYVDALLEVHEKNAAMVARSFQGEAGFVAALDKACMEFVNRNAATEQRYGGRRPVLRMVLFKYLEDKDVFQTFYIMKLVKRLIHGTSASDEAEASMTSKLAACGFGYTDSLQRMLIDKSHSKDVTDSFKEHMSQNHDDMDIVFSIMMLGTNLWPLPLPTHDFLLPPELRHTFERFTRYYQTKACSVASFLPCISGLLTLPSFAATPGPQADVAAQLLKERAAHKLHETEAAVLLQYNHNDTLSLAALQEATKISIEILEQVLVLLIKLKVLVNNEKDQYDLNPGFQSMKTRVNLNLPIETELNADLSDVPKAVDEDRKWVLQATIVRIMKARKTMKNQALIHKVISQISQRFAPKIPDIETAIATLLEKEYIERVDGSRDTFGKANIKFELG
ncbi:Cullin family-domain-containing protein [Mycena olivaceomarginata]|nr:Cullin family-domain-containing protein [Mycena olivaceomarginata]